MTILFVFVSVVAFLSSSCLIYISMKGKDVVYIDRPHRLILTPVDTENPLFLIKCGKVREIKILSFLIYFGNRNTTYKFHSKEGIYVELTIRYCYTEDYPERVPSMYQNIPTHEIEKEMMIISEDDIEIFQILREHNIYPSYEEAKQELADMKRQQAMKLLNEIEN